MRGGLTASVVFLSVLGCAGPEPPVRTPGSARSRGGLNDLAAWLHDELVSGSSGRVARLLLDENDLDLLYDASLRPALLAQLRAERRHVEGAATGWGRFAGSAYGGFCARGVAMLQAGQRGLVVPVETVDELLVVGRFAGSEWAGWVREIIHTSRGFRLAKLPADAPRSGHPDLDLWACEIAQRGPGPS